MFHKTIRENDCGNCKHWHQWGWERERKYWEENPCSTTIHDEDGLHFGDCDKIPEGTDLTPSESGKVYKYDGYSFEDECYDEEFHCFELREVSE